MGYPFFDEPSRPYAWCFDKDHLATGDDEPDIRWGPSDAPDRLIDRLELGLGHQFRLYDDDDELYYTGRLVTEPPELDPFDLEDDIAFAPLDDYGKGGAGCTRIDYKRPSGRWEQL